GGLAPGFQVQLVLLVPLLVVVEALVLGHQHAVGALNRLGLLKPVAYLQEAVLGRLAFQWMGFQHGRFCHGRQGLHADLAAFASRHLPHRETSCWIFMSPKVAETSPRTWRSRSSSSGYLENISSKPRSEERRVGKEWR